MEDLIPVVKEPLCCQSDEGFQQWKWSQSYFLILNIVCVILSSLSWFLLCGNLVPNLAFSRFVVPLKGRMLGRVEASQDEQQRFHISSRQTSHFHFKKETRLPWLELAFADTAQLFLRLYRISALLCESLGARERTTGDPPETIQCFRHSSFNRLPCSLQTPRLLARFNSAFTPIIWAGKENKHCC